MILPEGGVEEGNNNPSGRKIMGSQRGISIGWPREIPCN